jgi:hypothetical protein
MTGLFREMTDQNIFLSGNGRAWAGVLKIRSKSRESQGICSTSSTHCFILDFSQRHLIFISSALGHAHQLFFCLFLSIEVSPDLLFTSRFTQNLTVMWDCAQLRSHALVDSLLIALHVRIQTLPALPSSGKRRDREITQLSTEEDLWVFSIPFIMIRPF